MRITEIETIALLDPGVAGETIVRVHTDEGLMGIGQAESPSLVIEAVIKCQEGWRVCCAGRIPCRWSGYGRRCTPAPGYSGGAG